MQGSPKFTDFDPETAEGEMILKDRFLTQLAPDICCKLRKQVFEPNQFLKKCYSWLRWYIMVENRRRKKRTRQKTEAPTMAVRPALKQSGKMPRGTQVKRDRLVITMGRGASQAGLPSGI